MSDKKQDMQKIRSIEDKYGFMVFRMGLTHLLDVGSRNLGDDDVEEGVRQIIAQGEAYKAEGKIPIMTPGFQCNILRCAAEISKFSPWTLFSFIKKHVDISN
jgi:hypothetical protein